jgi:hypothetical protein
LAVLCKVPAETLFQDDELARFIENAPGIIERAGQYDTAEEFRKDYNSFEASVEQGDGLADIALEKDFYGILHQAAKEGRDPQEVAAERPGAGEGPSQSSAGGEGKGGTDSQAGAGPVRLGAESKPLLGIKPYTESAVEEPEIWSDDYDKVINDKSRARPGAAFGPGRQWHARRLPVHGRNPLFAYNPITVFYKTYMKTGCLPPAKECKQSQKRP